MADMVIDTTFNLNATQALNAIANIGKKIDELFAKLGLNSKSLIDPKPSTDALKKIGDDGVAAFTRLRDENGRFVKEQVDGAEKVSRARGSNGRFIKGGGDSAPDINLPKGSSGLFDSIGGGLASLVSPAGLATAGIAALGAGLAATFEIGKEFETGLQAVSAVTGVTGAALEDIGDRAQGLAAQFGGSAKEQLEVFQTTLSKIGPQLAQDSGALTTFAENVNVLSKTDSALGAAGAVDALTGAMLQFGVNVNDSNEVARESGRFINVLAASAAVGSASVSDVAGAIAVVGATAKNANVSFEETNAALQVLASKSLVGSQAGTALTAVVNKLQSASGPAAAQLKKMGTSSEELGKILTTQGIGPAMEKLKTGMNTLGSTSEKNAFLVSLFGETGVNAAAALLSGSEQLKEFTKGVTGTTAATDQAAINMSTLSERISRGTAALQNIAIDTYRVLAPILSNVIGTVSEAFGKVQAAIAPIFARLTKTFGDVFNRIRPVFTAIAGFIGGAWLLQITTIFSAVGTAVNVVLTVFNKLFDGIVSAVQPVIDALKKAFGFTDDATKSIDVLEIFGNVLSGISDAISFFGDILVEIGGFLVEFLITPLKLGFTVLSVIIEPIVNFGKSLFNVGETTKSAGGFFSSFIEIVKQAPEFIKAVTAGFKSFVGSITDLITNFSFDKLTKVLKGETFSEAFTGSLDKTKLEAAQKATLAAFDNTFKELAKKRTAYESAKTEEEKASQKTIYDNEIKRIADSIDAKKAAGVIDAKQAETLNQKLLDITKARQAAETAESAKAAAAAKAGEKGKQDSLKEEIAKAQEENRKLRGESDAAQIKDELERAVKANEEKFLAAQRAVQKEIEEVKKKKDVSDKERQALLELLYEKENLVLENGLNTRDEIIAKHTQKQRDEAEKEAKDYAKSIEDRNKEVEKINAELDKKEAEANRKAIEERIAAEQKYAETHKSIFQQLADNTIDIFKGISDGFTQAFTVDNSAGEAAKKEADAQLTELKKSLQARVISFSDYQDKVAEISAKAADAGGDAGKSFGDKFVDGLNKSLGAVSKVFDNIGKGVLKQYESDNKEVADINKELEKELILQKELGASDTIEQAQERDKTIAKLREKSQKAEIGSLSDMEVAYTAFGVVVGGSLLQAVADGTNLWQAFVLSAFDALTALVPVFTAMILGKELAEKGIFGLATAPILTGLLLIAVNLAKAAVTSGFYSGGYTGDGSDNTVKGVVHEEEYVFSKRAVRKEVSAFDELHNTLKNGVSLTEIMSAYKYPELSTTFVGTQGIVQNYSIAPVQVPIVSNNDIVAELRELRRDNTRLQESILEATEAMPSGFRGNVKHDFEFHHDPSIAIKKAKYNERRKALQGG